MDSFVKITDHGHGGWKVAIVAAVLIVMQSLMLVGRYVSRRLRNVSLASDDYMLLLATIFTLALCALAIACECQPVTISADPRGFTKLISGNCSPENSWYRITHHQRAAAS